MTQPTVVALATGAAPAGVAILRLSGEGALPCARKLAALPDPMPERRAVVAAFHHPASGEWLDRGLVLYFRAPASFTGEDVVELHCHGGARQVECILEALYAGGARAAEPGEFSRRAVVNGRLSLEQAEALCDLVAAETEAALKAARAGLRGKLGEAIGAIGSDALALLAEVEAALDFPDDVGEPAAQLGPQLGLRCQLLADRCRQLEGTFRLGRLLREGARVVFAGAPNAGKSSLFNALLGEGRAIVDDEPGTTRDSIEARMELEGLPLTLVDTAGLRQGGGRVELRGMERAREELERASLALWVVDATAPVGPPEDLQGACFTVVNKCDRDPEAAWPGMLARTSATGGEGLEALKAALARTLRERCGDPLGELVITNRRHAELLREAAGGFETAAGSCVSEPLEIVAYDLRDAQRALDRILGKGVDDALLDEIFARFCIGK